MNELRAARVRVPCSTSNLGSGFDAIGLALRRYLDARFAPEPSGGLRVERSGTLFALDPTLPDLVAQAFVARLGSPPSGTLHLHSDIPVARGLGASAAALVAGWDLALASHGDEPDPEGAFISALEIEGHGDNAAPSVHGGLRGVVQGGSGEVRSIPLELSRAIGFAYAAPGVGVSTRQARAMLPAQVPHGTATRALGRVVALVRGLADGDPELIRLGVLDDLHVAYRLQLIPRAEPVVAAGLEAGAWAVTVSGAGSGLIALCPPRSADDVATAMRETFSAGGDATGACVGFAVEPDREGACRLPSDP